MSFKINKLAACIAMAAVMPTIAINAQSTDHTALYSAKTSAAQNAVIYVHLSQFGSLSKATLKNKKLLDSKRKRIQQRQQKIIADIKAIDGAIEIVSSSKLFGNYLRIKAGPDQIAKIKAVAGVKHVNVEAQPVSIPASAINTLSAARNSRTQNDADVVIPPLSDNANAGEGVKIAIIGTGVDYTHKSLGGAGTAEAYADAIANAAAPFDGFPTDVVVDGFDLSSENFGQDLNPIDQNVSCMRWDGQSPNTGFGTRLASAVHQLAPGAKLAAYKTSDAQRPDPDTCQLRGETTDKFVGAIERAVDPKGDGSFEGRADIIVIDAYGNAGFYHKNDEGISAPVVETYAIEMASALGTLVVVNAGSAADIVDNHYNLAWRAAAPSALTVGGMSQDAQGVMKVTAKTPYGPVRGSNHYSKPDMVSYAEGVEVAVAGANDSTEKASDSVLGAARIAAAAAIIKSERPELSMTEVKALLMNTADSEVTGRDGKQAELTLIGNGMENMEAALSSSAVIWEKGSYQPNLNFGFQEGESSQRFVKQLQIKNLSEETVTYQLSVENDGKDGVAALTWELPASVSVPAGQTVVFPAVLSVDFTKLDNWPLNTAADFNNDNWAKIELTGKLMLTAEDHPSLSVSWLAKPRAATEISRDFSTLESVYQVDPAFGFGPMAGAYMQDFTNRSPTETTFAAVPLMFHTDSKPDGKEYTRGNLVSDFGGGVYDEAQCESGKKLIVATRFFDPNASGMANHLDRGFASLFEFSVYQEEFVMMNRWDQQVTGEPRGMVYDEGSQMVMSGFIEPDENMRPVAWYVDYNMTFDYTNPRGRYKKSTLPTYVNAHGQSALAQYCLEDLYHGSVVNSVDSFSKNHGWIVGTDRDARNDIGEPMMQYNPVKYGKVETQDDFGGGIGINFGIGPGPAPAPEKNLGGLPLFSKPVEQGEAPDYSPIMTLASGETAQLTAVSECAFEFGFGPVLGCQNPGMLLMSLNDNWSMWSRMDTRDSIMPMPKADQEHSVNEDAQAGAVVGTIELDANGFFADADFDHQDYPYNLNLMNAIAGEPFAVDAKGVITVNNPDAIDFDQGHERFELEVVANKGNNHSPAATIYVNINPVNDIAPELVAEFAAVTVETGEAVEVNAAGHFTDAEGDALTFTAEGLPDGVTIDANSGIISGASANAGGFDVTVTADDTVNTAEANFLMTVNAQQAAEPPQESDSSSGSFGFGLLAFAGLLGAVRRRSMTQ